MMCLALKPNRVKRLACLRDKDHCGRHQAEVEQTGMYRHTIVFTWPGTWDCPQPEYPEIEGS